MSKVITSCDVISNPTPTGHFMNEITTSYDVIPDTTSTNLVDYSKTFAQILAETTNALVAGRGNFISIKDRRFTTPDSMSAATMTGVVLDFIRFNQLMPPYVPGVRSTAQCWALNRSDAKLTPDPEKITNPGALTCALCPNNKFKSRGNGKACSNKMRLVLVPAEFTEDSDIFILQLPPTSLADWTNYVSILNRTVGTAGFCKVITEFSHSPQTIYSKPQFKQLGVLASAQIPTILALRDKAQDALFLEPSAE